jgi:hypothetical protein
MREEGVHFGRSHVHGVTLPMKQNETPGPTHVRFLCGARPWGQTFALFVNIRMKTSKVFSCLKIRLSPPSSSEDRRSGPGSRGPSHFRLWT